MPRIFLSILLVLLTQLPSRAQSETTLVIKGVPADVGLLLIAICSEEANWLTKTPTIGMDVPVKRNEAGDCVVRINKALPEKVAVAVIHDANGNRDMDRNLIGIPQEAYGFSRGVRPRFGPPKFADALTASGGNIEISVDTLL
ncbi:MAG: DUF2141 domain-containing protein [Verrucomicrobiales bacterium]